MYNAEINIDIKNANSGSHINYKIYKPWHIKTAWMGTLCQSSSNICQCQSVPETLKSVAHIKKVMSWKIIK